MVSSNTVWGLSALVAFVTLACGKTEVASGKSEVAEVGAANPAGGPAGEACSLDNDCRSGVCARGTCQESTVSNGLRRAEASKPKKFPTDHDCNDGSECEDAICDPVTKRCKAAAFDDGVRNGGETDIDCGGPGLAKRCAAGQRCTVHGDCGSNGCAFDGTCAIGASCTQLEGGQTCGPSDGMTKQNDCCDRAAVGPYTVDKYLITAGRMRGFLQRLDGKVRDFAATLPAEKWDQAWTAKLPNQIEGEPGDGNNANTQLGPYFGKRSCESGGYTGHTFHTPVGVDPPGYGDAKEDFSRQVLDTKALNCVPWWLIAALCVFDGGHLLREAELRAAYTNNGTTAYPWGDRGTYSTSTSNEYAVQLFGYQTPAPPADARRAEDGDFLDMAFYIAPPGRRPLGYNAAGHADLVGNLLEWVGDSERQFVWKGSFETHAEEADRLEGGLPLDDDPYLVLRTETNPWRWHEVVASGSDPQNVNGYYAIGGRCGY